MIQKSELECNIDTLFIKPALISIVREFTKNKKNVEIAEPVVSVFDETDDTITVIVYLPVLEIAQ